MHRRIAILALVLLPLALAFSDYVATENEELYGTWENREYAYSRPPGTNEPFLGIEKVVYEHGGECKLSGVQLHAQEVNFSYTITSKWKDSDGNVMYKHTGTIYFEYGGKRIEQQRFFAVVRINQSKQTLEVVTDFSDYPPGVSADHSRYNIYYRQK